MDLSNEKNSFDALCKIIQEFAPCVNDYLYVCDIPGDTYFIAEQALERFRLPSNCFHDVERTHAQFVYPEDFPLLQWELSALLAGEKTEHNLEYRWIGQDGQPIWINCRGRVLLDDAGAPSLLIGCINEIGKKQKADNISGLLGESSFKDHLRLVSQSVSDMMLLRIGIDDFKIINERFGIDYGNTVLRDVAECIRSFLNPGQFVYRIVSDEFLIMDISGSDAAAMDKLYHRIRSGVDKILAKQNYMAIYTISGGLVHAENVDFGSEKDYTDTMKLSEFALTEAKNRGKNQLYILRQEDYTAFLRRRYIRSSMRQAISEDFKGFEIYFQPIVMTSGENLFAAEALMRFRSPSGEPVSPVEFVPILEESGLIIPVGKWLIEQALSMCKLVRNVYPDFRISINLSYIQLLKAPVYEDIVKGLEKMELPPESLIVELTESGHLEDSIGVRNVWRKLKKLGVNIALDDFGTGYSNLINIGNLRPNIVKIDRSFTVKSLKNDYEFELLVHIIRMVHSIGLHLVVEGIETPEELRQISELSPDYIQGFYYSMPCPQDEFFRKYSILRA